MGITKALLVGISEYPAHEGCSPLPMCINDLYAVKDALTKGLNIDENNIILCGEEGIVTLEELLSAITSIISNLTNDDSFIFYFTGHGGENCLALSYNSISFHELIDELEKIPAKNKIIILDSCRSGDFTISGTPQLDTIKTIENFVGYGYALLASCGAEQSSGFNSNKQISLYTSFLCDALTNRFLIKKGKKSLETINESIFHFAKIWNQKEANNIIQDPIFRSNIGGTIFFDVEEYNPYKVHQIYEETDNYIIYSVEPVHHASAKRLSVKVILRFQSTMEEIADIASEIRQKILYYEVHQNEIAEARHRGKAANIIWCYFGYDEDDIIDTNFICYTTWVDDTQDKKHWYSLTKNVIFTNNVHININNLYKDVKDFNKKNTASKDELIAQTLECTRKIISFGEQYINFFREYLNNTISEEKLIEIVAPLNDKIETWYFKQTELPIAPKELNDWSHCNTKIACTIHDFSLFYSKKNLNIWNTDSRKFLMKDAIKRYEDDLEELKELDKIIKNMVQ